VSLDLLIPFGILLALVIYLIFTRNAFEKQMLNHYEGKFDEWKTHNTLEVKEDDKKELVGLLYKQHYKYHLEVFEEKELEIINVSKINIKEMT